MSSTPPVATQIPAPVPADGPASAPGEQLHSKQLFGSRREVLIEHAGCTYRLRITQANKLILTK